MKVYTKSGDKGKTSLFSGERVSKCEDRVETYGELDELNAAIGLIASVLPKDQVQIFKEVHNIQKTLFTIGAWLATKPGSVHIEKLTKLSASSVDNIETSIDQMSNELPELHAFILPGGSQPAACAHSARTICRRVERHVIRLFEKETVLNPEIQNQYNIIQKYLNRLSDYLFTLARYLNMKMNIQDNCYNC